MLKIASVKCLSLKFRYIGHTDAVGCASRQHRQIKPLQKSVRSSATHEEMEELSDGSDNRIIRRIRYFDTLGRRAIEYSSSLGYQLSPLLPHALSSHSWLRLSPIFKCYVSGGMKGIGKQE